MLNFTSTRTAGGFGQDVQSAVIFDSICLYIFCHTNTSWRERFFNLAEWTEHKYALYNLLV